MLFQATESAVAASSAGEGDPQGGVPNAPLAGAAAMGAGAAAVASASDELLRGELRRPSAHARAHPHR